MRTPLHRTHTSRLFLCLSLLLLFTAHSTPSTPPDSSPPPTPSTVTASWRPRIFVTDDFLAPWEADYLIARGAENGLARSLVGRGATEREDTSIRSSAATFLTSLAHAHDPVLRAIEDRIAAHTRLPASHGEPLQVQRYERGERYEFHTDVDARMRSAAACKRVATFLMYLTDVEEGGETSFPLRYPAVSLHDAMVVATSTNKVAVNETCARRDVLNIKPKRGE